MTLHPTTPRRHRAALRTAVSAIGLLLSLVVLPGLAMTSPAAASPAAQGARAAVLDAQNLRLAAQSIEAQALATGVLRAPVHSRSPAVVILLTDEAFLAAARHHDRSRNPVDTRAIMGQVPYNVRHRLHRRPHHVRHRSTRTLHQFRHPVSVGGAYGVGAHDGAAVAPYQRSDGVYVDPRLPALAADASIAASALRTGLRELGQPYVWGGAGPSTYDCSGLVMRAYARAGIRLAHYTGTQWNEGRLIPGRDVLPGDLVLFGHSLFHVGMYLGAGWMLNAPFTGHYVDVVPVWEHVAGVVRP